MTPVQVASRPDISAPQLSPDAAAGITTTAEAKNATMQQPLLAGEHTLPASWWFNENIFNLEKRAIFHKSWLFCTHASRFTKPGDYYSFQVTGIKFFIIKSRSGGGELKAFHNVCRHRAFPVVQKSSGSSTVLTCKYHGWNYNSDGKLSNAPKFDNKVEGFEKSENSLYPINIHVTPQGLVFVNFSINPVPFDEWFGGLTDELHEFDFGDYEYHMSYELHGDFNWKTLMDGYQECYHCPIAHPGLNSAFKMETYKVVPKNRYCRHYATIVREEPKKERVVEKQEESSSSSWFGFGKKSSPPKATTATAVPPPSQTTNSSKTNRGGEFDGLWVYLFPNNGVNCYSPAWYSIRVLPLSATKTTLQYDIYTKKGIDEATKTEFVDFLQQVEIEDFDLCQLTQQNLNEGIYSSGYLHPTKENGVLYYQSLVRDAIKEHLELEKANGGKHIDPAAVAGQKKNKDLEELEGICQSLECASGQQNDELNW
ncbi:hypothetical protein CANMA_000397 [Candida margitis]|uniref:uncharacterized protein n=1 Tax=Candida margitis TaxID=1775924 RepID=UPI002227CE11|nr:uncharacterized protein CANMA_000397 [Candida margitis]KAI5970488.1 hypothetical protein CANMA_000397 [Candida margitis]